MATAWYLNLDADVELALPEGAAYTPSEKVSAHAARHVERLARELLAPGDVRVDAGTPPGSCRGMVGRAFCPTRRAREVLQRAGAEVVAPTHGVLRAVNGRGFAAGLGQTLPGAVFARSAEEVAAVVSVSPPVGGGWRLKRAHGMAGRGQRVVPAGVLDEASRAFVVRSLEHDGLQVEPNVRILREYAVHGWLTPAGACEVGRPVVQVCDAKGQWVSASREGVHAEVASVLVAEAPRVGAALSAEGYFGPFGVDAFTYETAGGEAFQPRSEVNARLSMAYGVGMGRVPAPAD